MRLDLAGADGLVLFNRFLQPDVDPETMTVTTGVGLSSPAEARLPRTWIAILRGHVTASLAATTGVEDAGDVAAYLLAGADVVMTASALLRHGLGPRRGAARRARGLDGGGTGSRRSTSSAGGSRCRPASTRRPTSGPGTSPRSSRRGTPTATWSWRTRPTDRARPRLGSSLRPCPSRSRARSSDVSGTSSPVDSQSSSSPSRRGRCSVGWPGRADGERVVGHRDVPPRQVPADHQAGGEVRPGVGAREVVAHDDVDRPDLELVGRVGDLPAPVTRAGPAPRRRRRCGARGTATPVGGRPRHRRPAESAAGGSARSPGSQSSRSPSSTTSTTMCVRPCWPPVAGSPTRPRCRRTR